MNNLAEAKRWLKEADFILIGAGAGLSTAAGLTYGGPRFRKYFSDYEEAYGFHDMYSGMFYPFKNDEELWAYRARHILLNRYSFGKNPVYGNLLRLVQGRDYFVLTTNVDHQFLLNGFDSERLFYVQGDYGEFQCTRPGDKTLYPNETAIRQMVKETKDFKIPTALIPRCPLDGAPLDLHLRRDDSFVEDAAWQKMADRYSAFLKKMNPAKVVLLEIGVGFNTPGIIRYPFEKLIYTHSDFHLIRLNADEIEGPEENNERTAAFLGNAARLIVQLLS
jgi:NAD-dependent SIR2 family protein deacetylase